VTESERKLSEWSDEASARLREYNAGLRPGAFGSCFDVDDNASEKSA
jgi:hypothetical protein